ncbi:GIY-YIG nuclease family protein [Neobacillus ginsengisoli]|uniref:Excinuclease UvrABC nuclease subunit n=1 Tax=Neobacillus ginsengisoli TaxID=904295 RepID=A0ABT9XNG7_9BACI|nr:excinuclease UvrABC nuclease subunit [Neobacillus ginsengisoli]
MISDKPGIYMICDRDERKYYVGASSSSCYLRVLNHIHHLKNHKHISEGLQKAFNKGNELEFVQLVETPNWEKTEILELERRLIFALKSYEYSFNTKNVPPEILLRS